MTLTKRGRYIYSDDPSDIPGEIIRYSRKNGYPATQFAGCICHCGGTQFRLALDDDQGVAVRTCIGCSSQHPIGDSEEYLEEAELGECACPCEAEVFEIAIGVSLYDDTDDVRWLYVGCRCLDCGLTAVYGDWKNEFVGYRELLARV